MIPELLGGPDTLMIGRVLWDEFFNNRDWPIASAVAIVMLLLLMIPILIFKRCSRAEQRGSAPDEQRSRVRQRPMLVAGLRVPVPADRAADGLLVQRIAAGDGLGRLLDSSGTASCCDNEQMLGAAWLSLKIAFYHRDRARSSWARWPRSC